MANQVGIAKKCCAGLWRAGGSKIPLSNSIKTKAMFKPAEARRSLRRIINTRKQRQQSKTTNSECRMSNEQYEAEPIIRHFKIRFVYCLMFNCLDFWVFSKPPR